MEQLFLLKYSTHDCSVCRSMSAFDAKVAGDLGLSFVDVDLRNPEVYRRYRKILLTRFPYKQSLALPTYLLVDEPSGDFSILGEVIGGMPEQVFRDGLQALLPPDRAAEGASARPRSLGPGVRATA
ncbi:MULTISPECIES: thioredoxin family protein [Aphanothece]|uniref:thioredoxin family protein n=1 Tax=Aphanothece TaxID=1121 RepID=UPI003985328B